MQEEDTEIHQDVKIRCTNTKEHSAFAVCLCGNSPQHRQYRHPMRPLIKCLIKSIFLPNHFNPIIQQDYWSAVGGRVEQEAGPRWRSFLSCLSAVNVRRQELEDAGCWSRSSRCIGKGTAGTDGSVIIEHTHTRAETHAHKHTNTRMYVKAPDT